MTLVLGVDVGTSGAKATLVGVKDDLAIERRSVTVAYRHNGEPSRDPARWVGASLEALEGLEVARSDPIEAIGFTGQMDALVAVDEEAAAVVSSDALARLRGRCPA
jgi:sugar (pentulose or hexulose) kinase